jgi:hypothetical protein
MDLGALYDAWASRLLAYMMTMTRDRSKAIPRSTCSGPPSTRRSASRGAELARAKSGKVPERLETPDPFTGKPLTVDAAGKIASAESAAGVQPNNDPIEWVLRTKK